MNLLQNPLFLKIVFLLLAAGAAFVFGAWLMRRMRRRMLEEPEETKTRVSGDNAGFSIAAYDAVIRQYKEQQAELQRLSKQERANAAARENMSEAVLSNLSSGVILFNTASIVRQANEAARTILGFGTAFGLHGRDIFRGVSAIRTETGESHGNSDPLLAALDQALRAGRSFRRMEAEYTTPQGLHRVLGITLSPVRGPNGESLGAACLVSDLTQISDLAKQVRLQENMAALGEMSAGIAHEFKNSLATISGYAQMLQKGADAQTSRAFAEKIATETAALSRIVTDFLVFARPREIVRQDLAVRPLLQDCARESGVDIDITAVADDAALSGDATVLRQAFSNLLRNSAEAARDGAPARVKVSSSTGENGMLRLVFQDNGRGISQPDLQRVFIPFFTTKAEGTGLGLPLVHRIVTEHGGAISIASDEQGTLVTVQLPAATSAVAAEKG